jgi:mono/diheme cytochrome c family protein
MFSKQRYCVIGAILMVAGWVAGCAPALYKPDPAQTYQVPLEQLLEGRKLYVSACGSCHSLYLPHQYSMEVWRHNLDEMQERSKISDLQKELIFTYLENYPRKGM